MADVIARFKRHQIGSNNVFFNTGVDEHGQKIYNKAIELGIAPQEYCDRATVQWKEFCKKFNISYDYFYRTTSVEHKQKAVTFFQSIDKQIYLSKYSSLYCDGCESFKTSKDLNESGRCPHHTNLEIKQVSEENFFLKLKEFAQRFDPKDILIDSSLNGELKNIIDSAEDISISRENVSWAIPIPNTNQTMYVWQEALICYYSSLSETDKTKFNIDEFWENSLIICGKDNLRFQAFILPALLDAVGLPPPSKVLVHGTIVDKNGNKMSKTIGNVIDPIEQLDKYGLTPLRYYLTCGLNTFHDSNYSEQELIDLFNSDIVNGYGNLIARALHLLDLNNIKFDINNCSTEFLESIDNQKLSIEQAFNEYDFRRVRNALNSSVFYLNSIINDTKPYSKDCSYEAKIQIISEIYYGLKVISEYYKILLPEFENKINQAFIDNKKVILFNRIV